MFRTKVELYNQLLLVTIVTAIVGTFIIFSSVMAQAQTNVSGNITVEPSKSFVDTVYGTLQAGFAFYTVVSGVAIFLAIQLRNALKNSKAEWAKKLVTFLEGYLIPAFQKGDQFVQTTKNQETKILQMGQILYDFMGPAADKIKDKYQVRITQMEKDLMAATVDAKQYQSKIVEFVDLINQLRGEAGLPRVSPEDVLGNQNVATPAS